MPDVLVIGGGPAGSMAALLLARAGREVTLVEQHRFPRDKVCGECLSALGYDVLARQGLADRFREAGAVSLNFAAIHVPDGRSARLQLPRPMWGLSRSALDSLLLQASRDWGVRIRQPARCEGIRSADGSWLVAAVRDSEANRVNEVTAQHIILADGKGALTVSPPPLTSDFGIKTHFSGVDGPRDVIELFGTGRGTYGGLAAIEAARWNAAFSVPAVMLREHRGDVQTIFDKLLHRNGTLRHRLRGAERVGPWLAGPLPRFAMQSHWPPGVIPVGNAAAAIEPIGGEGMGLALRSAELAAAALTGVAANGTAFDADALRREFRGLWRVRRITCRAAALAVAGSMAGLASEVLQADPALARVALRLLGKTRQETVSSEGPRRL